MSGVCKEECDLSAIILNVETDKRSTISTIPTANHPQCLSSKPNSERLRRPPPADRRPTGIPKRTSNGRAELVRPVVRPALSEYSARLRDDRTGAALPAGGPMSSCAARAAAVQEAGLGGRQWDEIENGNENGNGNGNESRQDERTALRGRPHAFGGRSRRATRKTPISPDGMASIARRSPNGRGATRYSTSEWVRKIPVQNFSRSRTKRSFSPTAGAPASRS